MTAVGYVALRVFGQRPILVAIKTISFLQQRGLPRRTVTNTRRDKTMKLGLTQ